ncbi:MAG TPA: DUF1559 domain-containing protein [Gemmataceae bacterium]|nr:DUF1559 domain-containing protein [Gemmataceae bacterium]
MKATGRGWKLWSRAAFLTAVAAAAVWLAGRSDNAGRAAPGDAPKATGELDAVPIDGAAAVSVNVAQAWNDPGLKAARERLAKDDPQFGEHMANFAKEIGVAPEAIERVTVVQPTMQGPAEPAIFITTIKPYDAKKVAAAVAPDGKEESINSRTLQVGEGTKAVGFLTDRTFVHGPVDAVREILKKTGDSRDGPMAAALREAAAKHCVVAALDVQALAKTAPPNPPPQAAPYLPLLKAKTAVLTVDFGDEVKVDVRATFDAEADAKNAEPAANTLLDMARAGLAMQMTQIEGNKELADMVGLLKQVQAGLQATKVVQNGSMLEASGSVKINSEKAGVALLEGVQKVRDAAARMQSINNLKQIALAMFNYESTFNHFPAQAICDKNGKPLLSWRVAVLPYIEQDQLYKQFHLDEPWDSENNKKLLEQMPKTFASPAQSAESLKNHETPYQGFVGKGAFFEGQDGIKIADITDGTSNTIMLVETAKTVPWTKPDDIAFDQGKLLPKVGGIFKDIFLGAMCDGSVRSFSMSIKEDTLRALITRNGGEVVDPNK